MWTASVSVDLETVSTWRGHADISTTLTVYAHRRPGTSSDDAVAIDAFLAEQG